MSDIGELELRILSELEELRDENIFSMVNTIFEPTGEHTEVEKFVVAVRNLVQSEYVIMGTEEFVPANEVVLSNEESLELTHSLAEWFVFDAGRALWTCAKGPILETRIPTLIATDAGVEEGFKILDKRGYQWWREE